MAQELDLDLRSITLGEMAEAEAASGKSFDVLLKGRANLIMLVLFLGELRSSGVAPKWSDLGSRRPLDSSFSLSLPAPDGLPPKSDD